MLNRLSGAVEIEKVDKLQVLIEGLAQRFIPAMRRAFLGAVAKQKARIDRKAAVQAIANRDVEAVVAALNLDQGSFREFQAPLREAFEEGGKAGAANPPRGSRLEVTFDVLQPRSGATMQGMEARLRQTMSADAEAAVRKIVNDGLRDGKNPRTLAGKIANVVGLSDRQIVAIENYRAALEGLKGTALQNALRDKRYDAALKLAIDKKEPLQRSRIEAMVARYTERQLRYRGEVIARTEATRAVNRGQHEAILQGSENDPATRSALRRFWKVAKDERTCSICKPIPGDHPNGVAMEEPFVTSIGPVLMPPVHPDCRCTIAFRLVVD